MKRLFVALAAAAIIGSPVSAMAQMRGGHGGFVGGWHGGGWSGGWHGGWGWGGGWHGGWWPFWGGVGLGWALSYPWYYWGGPYGYWGAPYPYSYYGYGYPYDGYYDRGPSPPYACGQWVWHADQNRYEWVPGPCAGHGSAPAPAP
jgi:hypothetical protein